MLEDKAYLMAAQISQFSYQGSKIDSLDLLANYRPYTQHQYRIELRNNNLVWDSYKLTDIAFVSEGNQHQQQSNQLSTVMHTLVLKPNSLVLSQLVVKMTQSRT